MPKIRSFESSQVQFPFPVMQSADEFVSWLEKLRNGCLGTPVLLITTGCNCRRPFLNLQHTAEIRTL